MRISFFSAVMVSSLIIASSAQVFEGYSADLSSRVQTPAAGMASFLKAAEGTGLASMSEGVGAASLQIITACTVSNSGSMLKSLGGAFGN